MCEIWPSSFVRIHGSMSTGTINSLALPALTDIMSL